MIQLFLSRIEHAWNNNILAGIFLDLCRDDQDNVSKFYGRKKMATYVNSDNDYFDNSDNNFSKKENQINRKLEVDL